MMALFGLLLTASVARADYQSGFEAYSKGDYATAAKEWQAAADKGEARAQHGLGLLYDLGRGVPADPAQAAKWYGLAAAQNLPDAQSNLGMLYAEGRGVPKDMVKANQLWTLASQSGDAAAQFNLGLSYYRGEGGPKSFPDAAKWFAKAAAGGEVSAQYAIGEMYRLGRGVPKDLGQARRWFTKAAKAGNAAAAERLASLPPDTGGGTVAAQPPATTESVMNPTPLVASTKTPTVGATQDTSGAGAAVTMIPPAATGTTTTETTTAATVPTLSIPPAVPSTDTGTTIAPTLTPSPTAAATAPTQSTDSGGTTTVLTASGLNGVQPVGNSRNGEVQQPSTPGVVVPVGSDVSSSTKLVPTAPAPTTMPTVIAPTPSTGVINLGLPLGGESASGTSAPAPAATTAPAPATIVASLPPSPDSMGGPDEYRVWIGTFKTETDARMFWNQERQRFPDLLKPLQLMVRQVDLGASQGLWFRVLGGPFDNRQAADQLCGSIKSRSPADDCRVVLN